MRDKTKRAEERTRRQLEGRERKRAQQTDTARVVVKAFDNGSRY